MSSAGHEHGQLSMECTESREKMATADFNKALHEHLGYEWDIDPNCNMTLYNKIKQSDYDAAARPCMIMKSEEVGAVVRMQARHHPCITTRTARSPHRLSFSVTCVYRHKIRSRYTALFPLCGGVFALSSRCLQLLSCFKLFVHVLALGIRGAPPITGSRAICNATHTTTLPSRCLRLSLWLGEGRGARARYRCRVGGPAAPPLHPPGLLGGGLAPLVWAGGAHRRP